MSAIGSLVFCTDCGNLLDSSTGKKNAILSCDCCGAENKGLYCIYNNHNIYESLRLPIAPTSEAVRRAAGCDGRFTEYTAVQLRSADEGSTIFYTCDCGNKWNTNN
ncbi:hypothetical protein JHW43_002407 [Diplocarpon mali]|nr:hypothetical protein JHW43_002407 [Diplocarpon mali]